MTPLDDIKIGLMTAAWAEAQSISCDYAPELTSTNDLAKEDAFNGLDPLQIYLTDLQTQGRGRFDRTWESPPAGSSLLSSWSFQSNVTPSPFLTSIIGLGLFHAARATWPYVSWHMKAPNDLYIGAKKVAGLLVETVSQGQQHRIIIGLGFNILAHPKVNLSTNLFSEMTGLPLLGEDWVKFLDRFLFEMTLIIPEANKEPSTTLQKTLLHIFNSNPNLAQPYSDFKTLTLDLWR